jgi:hypothetical protein
MSKRTYAIVLIVAAIVIALALAMRGQGGGMLANLPAAIHGR